MANMSPKSWISRWILKLIKFIDKREMEGMKLETAFDSVCHEYDKWRPGYPATLYKDIFAVKELGGRSRALEIGCGTGQATQPILETGCALTAVEPGKHMAAFTAQKFHAWSNFMVQNMAFQDYDAPSDCLDLIYSASAFHWVPEETGYIKVLALLKSGGVFARFANHPQRNWQDALGKAVQRIYAVYLPGSSPSSYGEQDAKERAELAEKYGFINIGCKLYYRTRTFTAKEYVSLLGTYSDHIAMEERKRQAFFAEIQQVILSFDNQITLYDTIDLELARKP